MREILFKAKCAEEPHDWVEGYISKCEREFIIGNDDGLGIFIKPDTICQYTGLTDKNGNKIWENDIVLHSFDGDSGDETKAIVRYGKYDNNGNQDCYLGFYVDWQEKIKKRRDIGFWVYQRDIEVIGNTFDNPELLKGE